MCVRQFLFTALLCSVSSLFAQESDLEALKAQVLQMQKNYEARISALEKKIEQLEAGDKAKNQTIEELKRSNQAQQEKISTLAIGLQGTNITTDIFALSRQNEADIDAIEDHLKKGLNGLEYHGYLRSGFGTSGNGEIQPVFQAPGAAHKYRLGNEAETYLEMIFLHSTPDDQIMNDKLSIDTQIRLALATPMGNSAQGETTTSLRESFIKARGAIRSIPDITFWGGQRFYNRYSLHIDDYHFYDMSGAGGGVENIPLFESEATLALAWLGGSYDKLNSDGSVVQDDDFNLGTDTLNISIHNIPFLYGDLDILGAFSTLKGDSITDENNNKFEFDDSDGASLALIQKNKHDEWENIFGVMYGTGPAYNFKSMLTRPASLPVSLMSNYEINEARTFRVLDNLTRNLGERWLMSALLLYEDFDNGKSRHKWYSAGIRPIYHINDTFAVALEGSMDHSSTVTVPGGELYKLTIAPLIRPDISFFSRPELRFFLTYAWWSDEFAGYVGDTQYRNDTDGLSAGIQLETWW